MTDVNLDLIECGDALQIAATVTGTKRYDMVLETITRLNDVLDGLRLEARADGHTAFTAITANYEWRVEWKDDHVMRVECRPDEQTLAAYDAHRASYPNSGVVYPKSDWHGMDYMLISNVISSVGGGSVILDIPGMRGFHSRWARLTDDQVSQFETGNVPLELRKPWGWTY